MIGKIFIGKSFHGCLLYCLSDKQQKQGQQPVVKDRAEVLLFHQCYGGKQELTEQFREVRALNPRVQKPVLHITLGLAPGEQLDKATLMEMVEECARAMG